MLSKPYEAQSLSIEINLRIDDCMPTEGGGDSLIKVRTDVRAQELGISVQGSSFARALGFFGNF